MNKLNLGCGVDFNEGFVSVGFHSHINIDVQHNLNETHYPFKDNKFDYFIDGKVLEHLGRPYEIIKEIYRIFKPGGTAHFKAPHYSRGLTRSEHKAGFDVTFPYYFNPNFTKSGYYGAQFKLKKIELHYFAFFHLLPYMGVGKVTIFFMRIINAIINFFAKISPQLCSRDWCYWVGDFEEIEFVFTKEEN